ncbi:hypothetical protein FBALC1_01967 [Flavobacteriales bacterium ALC-1]|nr:hypothetical protein FBALC1_01967 [Flavobacteriales bacterium ALC-1]
MSMPLPTIKVDSVTEGTLRFTVSAPLLPLMVKKPLGAILAENDSALQSTFSLSP